MKKLFLVMVFASAPAIAAAADKPDWAFGPFPPAVPPHNATPAPVSPPEDGKRYTISGSTRSYTRTQMADPKNPQDWFPGDHAPMPSVVAHGNSAGARIVSSCSQSEIAEFDAEFSQKPPGPVNRQRRVIGIAEATLCRRSRHELRYPGGASPAGSIGAESALLPQHPG